MKVELPLLAPGFGGVFFRGRVAGEAAVSLGRRGALKASSFQRKRKLE
jgi:hypothetical protein